VPKEPGLVPSLLLVGAARTDRGGERLLHRPRGSLDVQSQHVAFDLDHAYEHLCLLDVFVVERAGVVDPADGRTNLSGTRWRRPAVGRSGIIERTSSRVNQA
jgi:hypothetical protein